MRLIAAALLAMLVALPAAAEEAKPAITRTVLQKLAYPAGHGTVLVLVEIAPGQSSGRHTHPGIETGYVLEGEVVMTVEGQPEQRLRAGDSYAIPAGTPHDVAAVGSVTTKAIATFVVEDGKPLAAPAP